MKEGGKQLLGVVRREHLVFRQTRATVESIGINEFGTRQEDRLEFRAVMERSFCDTTDGGKRGRGQIDAVSKRMFADTMDVWERDRGQAAAPIKSLVEHYCSDGHRD